MKTGMGKVIGSNGTPVVKFVSRYRWGGQKFTFRRFLDHVDPRRGSCADRVSNRHYLVEWEPLPNGEQCEPSWTHCDNFLNHRSGLQDYYTGVTSMFWLSDDKSY